jgi:EAL domain-containing protein (putative c-di-GMP-specific phosphodiesterase class I)
MPSSVRCTWLRGLEVDYVQGYFLGRPEVIATG